jgi:transcriptional regulator with XRE-family HTH domain
MHPRFGSLVRERRKALKLRQVDLAEQVGLCRLSIIRIEKGLMTPRYDQMLRLADILKIPTMRVAG